MENTAGKYITFQQARRLRSLGVEAPSKRVYIQRNGHWEVVNNTVEVTGQIYPAYDAEEVAALLIQKII